MVSCIVRLDLHRDSSSRRANGTTCAFPLYHRLALTYVPTKTVKFIDALEAERQGNEALGVAKTAGEGRRAERPR